MTLKADLYPTTDELVALRAVASGQERADLIVRGGRVQSPGTEEWLERDVIVVGRHIATLTPWGHFPTAAEEIDASGSFVVPGFIDAHLHIEYTNLTPGELARVSVPRGTTTVLTDPNAAANIWGEDGLAPLLDTGTPLRILHQVSPTAPTSDTLERGGQRVPESTVLARLAEDAAVTLGEANPFDYSEVSTARYREALVQGRRITGHTAAQTHESLWGYLAAGVSDDHNSVTVDEVLERTRLGAMITVMASSLSDNTATIFADLDKVAPALRSLCFCADDKQVTDLVDEGHIDHHIRRAIALGVDPQLAYRMATTQPAHYYRLDQVVGVLAPSRLADLLVIPDLADVRPSHVISAGTVVAQDGAPLFSNEDALPEWTRDTLHLPDDLTPATFAVRVEDGRDSVDVRAMELHHGYFKRAITTTLPVRDGAVQADVDQDMLKVVIMDRHHASGDRGIGFVRGFGLTRGALAVSMNCMNMNIAAVGTADDELLHAVRELESMGGGFVAVADGEVLARVPLPVGGVMSDAPYEQTLDLLREAHAAAAALGCPIRAPFMILSFVGLFVVPDIGLTELGLIDVGSQTFLDLVLPDTPGTAPLPD
ncbi:adenine deaminase C-terminal domain-containing protein [Demequina zhanjiangensis]|uniref:Adenine deaminase n=1 Tax=Demequina zhanjiangensis TaxID=3051659 RepID=A0ABT8G315_9MICO|nr:adenine deaminase C-terminal domain-containing protein [Demequina sp. SYSU T00b26]MDN4473526.1 adenine deaminase C-terminal domain-containing protein [Demequina sp. SYSU T00b26]